MSRVEACFAADQPPTSHQITEAFYQAREGNQLQTAKYLLDRGANINWIPPWAKARPWIALESGAALDHNRRAWSSG
jgi:uncharacterized protein